MKHLSYKGILYSFLIVLLSGLFGCRSELDKVVPKGAVAEESISANDLQTLRNGMYVGLEDFVYAYWIDFDLRAGNYRRGPGNTISDDPVNVSPSEGLINTIWTNAYEQLNKINFTIEVAGETDDPYATQVHGEALYLRAFIYYNLVTRWGGVPILTERTYDLIPRSSEEATWEQIITDLETAETMVSENESSFYVSKYAVDALLARVYLATDHKAEAVQYCDLVLNAQQFSLAHTALDFSSNWSAGSQSKELLFALVNNDPNNQYVLYQYFNDVDGSWVYSPEMDRYNHLYGDKAYAQGDRRAEAVFSAEDNRRIIKYPNILGNGLAPSSNANHAPLTLSRLPEIYLIKAEAQGVGADAAATLIPYFEARYESAPQVSDLEGLTPKEFQDMILDERQREFFAEGYRWFDLKRTGRTDLLPGFNDRDYLLYYPIPQAQIELGGYDPNPGYD